MSTVDEYAKKYLTHEIRQIERSERINELSELTIYEKACVYKYSLDGYENLNDNLRGNQGINDSDFGIYLEQTLSKLPNFDGLVYRGVNLNGLQLENYVAALTNKQTIKEYAFVSTSKSRMISMEYRGNTLFRIFSKFGKDIERISMYGLHNAQNEKEILFRCNSTFNVLEITNESDYTLITLEEV